MLKDMRAPTITVYGDSLLVFSQVLREYRFEHESLVQYCALANKLLSLISNFSLIFSVRGNNTEVNDFTQYASDHSKLQSSWALIPVQIKTKSIIHSLLVELSEATLNPLDLGSICAMDHSSDWRTELIQYLKDPTINAIKKLKLRVTHYVLF